jgi:anaerobic selenocysteine-containing dehydrogenase
VPAGADALLLTTSRTLYTSLEGATIRSEEADKLHREEFVEINPADASARGILQNHPVIISNGTQEIIAPAALTDAVAAGSVYLPLYFEGGVVNRLLPADGRLTSVTVRPA